MSVVKINVLTVPEDQRGLLEQRFAGRAGAVEASDGFEWFELLRPVEGTDTYLVYTRWRSEEDYRTWVSGRSTHGRPTPAATGTALWSFDVVQQAAPKHS